MKLPPMGVIEQICSAPSVGDVRAAVFGELERAEIARTISRGASVAITAGSRRIANSAEVLRTIAGVARHRGCEPFIVPAMGSHGGATAEGQAALLAGYGITEDSVGAPIRSSMAVKRLGATDDGVAVYMDTVALSADRIIVVNRVKAHTKFFGNVQSGLTKMLLLGLGNREGATECHRAAEQLGFDLVAETAAKIALTKAPVAFGLALVENSKGALAHIEAVLPDKFIAADRRLLRRANELMLRLPFKEIDVLIVDRIGKDISGTGMDVNVIGARPGSDVKIGRIFVRDLTDASEGNAHGIGFAGVTTKRLVRKIDMRATLENARAAFREDGARIPPSYETDRECLAAVLPADAQNPRIIWIPDTLHLERCRISPTLLAEAARRNDLRILSPLAPIEFDDDGNLPALDSRGRF